jgi:hypothetical protein
VDYLFQYNPTSNSYFHAFQTLFPPRLNRIQKRILLKFRLCDPNYFSNQHANIVELTISEKQWENNLQSEKSYTEIYSLSVFD